ncbi:GNAT family N-acetyltransferase [Aliiroseovarius subalbicans]|uniref:GNAT family N-acetyltransferase n=1 Tax=Aliiroseovarius subalbicans TaxID=2925840 RepID=UPI001F56E37C|nr:GNAT family N-acetyltransferase [Aliiroseovarius subalbicans]MCI2400772.1 GNAT family N-acetyltransferase [Aliiroseovarius subalbicans]
MIRLARAEDAGAIAALWAPQIRDTMVTFDRVEKTPSDVAAMILGRPAFYVAVADTVLGFATYDQFRGGVGYAHSFEHTIILDPCAQGQGIGRKLMQKVEHHARTAGGHSMIAGVSSGNDAGRAFHAALGYDQVAVVPEVGRKFDRWWDLILMQKFL